MYTEIDRLADNMLAKIFVNINVNDLDDYQKSFYVYKYMTENIKFDHGIWEGKKNKTYRTDLLQEVINVFELSKGVCSSMAQAYKLLLEKLGISALAVIGYDDGDIHQLVLVKRGENWSFDDVTLGVYLPEKVNEYFDYDNIAEKNQVMLGVLPDELYDAVFGRKVSRIDCGLVRKENEAFYELPKNIISMNEKISNLSKGS